MNYQDDAADRLRQRLADLNIGHRDMLAAALDLAGRQLEHLKPGVLATGKRGTVGGVFENVPRGCIVIVLAKPGRVATIFMPQQPDRAASIEAMARETREHPALPLPLPGLALAGIESFVDDYGGQPGKETPPLETQTIANMIGILFGSLSPDTCRAVIAEAEQCAAADICPALVGLVGPGSLSGAWPIALTLAPYLARLGDMEAR